VNVSLLSPSYPLRGGIAHHTYFLYTELSDAGHPVQVISYSRLYPALVFPGKTPFDNSNKRLEVPVAAAIDALNPASWYRAVKRIQAFGPDLVVIEWWSTLLAPALGVINVLLQQYGLKCVVECHNVLPHERSPFDLILLTWALSRPNYFIAHSTADRVLIQSILGPKTIYVAPLPPPTCFAGSAAPSRGGRTILFLGLVRKYKGLDILLRAMPRVLARTDCRLLIRGEFYHSQERYDKLILELGIGRQVSILNEYVPNEDIAALIDQADLLVLPYLSASQSGVARVAIASGLPIIASRIGGLPEAVIEGRNGLLVPPGNPDALADAIVTYFRDELGPRFSANILASNRLEPMPGIIPLLEEIAGKL
jgi:glycosyltransferase involved in cell wall biosynthesis